MPEPAVVALASSEPPKRDTAAVIAPPPLIYAAGLALGFGLQALLPSASVPDGVRWAVGGPFLLGGLLLARSFLLALRHARTPVDPYRPTTTLVTTGPYRLTRNPGYLAMALSYVGIAFLAGALWTLLVLIPTLIVVDRGVIAREERYLEGRFGEQYGRYKARTRRWI